MNKEQYDIEDIAIRAIIVIIEELLKIEEDRAEQVKGIAILKNIVEEIKP